MQIDYHDLIWAIINFVILLAILYKFLYGPLVKMMDSRENEIKDNISQAEGMRVEADAARTEMQEVLANSRKEAQDIINNAAKMGEDTKNQIIAEAKDAAQKLTQRAQEEIQREKEQALAEIRNEVAELAVLAAGQIIGKTITADEQKKLVDQYIQGVGGIQ
ncbi:F0F1 ATP synthase subunit B [Dehalobacterium formicoaceticum]|uniref:ATP synthase subunit b n=1 Tax=Dehalobacterium formicoaceticum TaxID=51515 RepID=A0ABT1Y3I1_9FIRM|nr:F0F1 ATP synthase subunit B [Dehalobacterium formicoaceticum]MCR6545427.1 F0F1 ATP synthase subunit B [Dehalobacterium formicoaceticum]